MMRINLFVLALQISILASCTPQPPTDLVPINNIASQSTNTLTPIHFETITPTLNSTSTSTLTPPPIWTSLPTLSSIEIQAKIKDLLETNGGCELPCWWGIVPGETAWTEALHFLNPFISDLEQSDPYARIENGKRHIYTEIQYYFDLPDSVSSGQMTLSVKDNIVFRMTVYPPTAEYKYQLHQILKLLGPPEQILINAQSSSPISELPPTVLTLDYSNDGVWVLYGYIPTQDGENLAICPKSGLGNATIYDNVGGRLELFDPAMKNDLTIPVEEYANMVGGFTAKNLEDTTNMNVEKFYTTFINPVPETCLFRLTEIDLQ